MGTNNPKGYSVKEAAEKVNSSLFLPDIQRDFRWEEERVIALFDSIWQNYPLGTIMVWKQKIEKYDTSNHYLYHFIQEAKISDNSGERLEKPARTNPGITEKKFINSVLDGQQRLTAVYLALYGGYRVWKGRGRHKEGEKPPLRELYFAPKLIKGTDSSRAFAFYDNEKIPTDGYRWFKVKDIVASSSGERYCKKENVEGHEKSRIIELRKKLTEEEHILIYTMPTQFSADDVLNIFLRMNSGGKPLKKTELLFALSINNWPSGREEIETLLSDIHDNIKKYGEWPSIDKDFILKTCLYLMDEKTSLSVSNMQELDFNRMERAWPEVSESIADVLKFLDEKGHSSSTIKATNAILPIIYYRHNNPKKFKKEDVKKQLNTMFIVTQIKSIFASSTDKVLDTIRKVLGDFNGRDFSYSDFATKYGEEEDDLNAIKCNEDTIMTWLFGDPDNEPLKKGEDTKLLLSCLPEYIDKQNYYYEQDYLHPAATFSNRQKISEMRDLGLTQSDIDEMNIMKDTLGNLQLYRSRYNQKKNDKPLDDWMKEQSSRKFKYDPIKKMQSDPSFDSSYGPYHIKNARLFMKKRGEMIQEELKKMLL